MTWAALVGKEGVISSFGALFHYFLRGVFVSKIWSTACKGWVNVPKIEEYGYKRGRRDGPLELVYNFEVQIKKISQQIDIALKGCGCKKNMCETRQCKCKKAGQECGIGCRCLNCRNTSGSEQSTARSRQPSEIPMFEGVGSEADNVDRSDGGATDSDSASELESKEDEEAAVSRDSERGSCGTNRHQWKRCPVSRLRLGIYVV